MAAILRVKRRNDDEALDALVIAGKRRKISENDEVSEPANIPPLTTVVKFAGTVKNQDENVVEHIAKVLSKDELQANFKQHVVDVLTKNRQQTKQNSVENRYKVINCIRSLNTSNIEEFENKVMTVIDVEDSVSCAARDQSSDTDIDYVYDLYYACTRDDIHIDNKIAVYSLDQEFSFDGYRNDSENECESEDSNDEANWRNDYPDSDDSEFSVDDDDIREAVMNMKLDSDNELSSDEDFVYAYDEKDVEMYGYKYAMYKARIKEELGEDDSDPDEDSNEPNEYEDDADADSDDNDKSRC